MLKIEFDKDVYLPGEDINVYISINLPIDTKIRYGILHLRYYIFSRDKSGQSPIKKILDEELRFIEEGHYPKGIYNYRLKYKLPENIPPTYRGRMLDSMLYYECRVVEKHGYEYLKRGELKITEKPGSKPKEVIYSVGSGKIHINLSISEPIIGDILLGVLSIEEGLELIRRSSIEICFIENYRVGKLKIFKGYREDRRCIPIYNIVISRDIHRYPIRVDLSKALRGRLIYTSPYEDEDISYKPYLKIRLSTKVGERSYQIPIKWYPYFESELSTSIVKDVSIMEERIKKLILKFFEDYYEGDIIDIQRFLSLNGINVNIYTLEKMVEDLIDEELIVVSDESPILRRYKFNSP